MEIKERRNGIQVYSQKRSSKATESQAKLRPLKDFINLMWFFARLQHSNKKTLQRNQKNIKIAYI